MSQVYSSKLISIRDRLNTYKNNTYNIQYNYIREKLNKNESAYNKYVILFICSTITIAQISLAYLYEIGGQRKCRVNAEHVTGTYKYIRDRIYFFFMDLYK